MSTPQFQRIPVLRNKKYKKSGIKSYAYALNKYGIGPTKQGPFFVGGKAESQGKFKSMTARIGGKTQVKQHVLMKRDAKGQSGEVGAQDIQHDLEYICPVKIGTPEKTLMLNFDTGSADLWVWSTELPQRTLTRFGSQHEVFDPSKSSTFKRSQGSTWQIRYGDSSSASGVVGTDNVDIGGVVVEDQAIELADELSQQFEESAGDGLLGLAYGKINTVKPEPVATPVENMIKQSDIPQSNELFTAYLGSYKDANEDDKGQSFYTFGFIDQQTLKAQDADASDIHYTPIDNSEGFWSVKSTSFTVNGTSTDLEGNTAIMDTGTTLALVSDQVCEAIYNAIPGSQYDSANQGYVFPKSVTAAELPVVEFDVGGKLFAVQKEDLAFADAGGDLVYGGVQSRGDLGFDILGDTFLKGIYAIFDQGRQRFGAVVRKEKFQNTSTVVPTAGEAGDKQQAVVG
ncbi:MAG: hypothetical protein M1831_004950 [Alyxoria varia]|nr:MAG: hypothetical protein M1831_004950 [Alyxoria varia]